MNLTALDWSIIVGYFVVSTLIGLLFTKRGGENLGEYFLSGRQVPWWLAGAAMVATTFAADTPLLVTGLIATGGLFMLWRLWIYGLAFLAMAVIFAALWHRSGVLTDAAGRPFEGAD